MSIAKIHEVVRSIKDQGQCEKCEIPLPKGSAYRWFTVGFRSSYKHKRCTKPECTPRPSERESSKLASIYAAQEDIDFSSLTSKEDIEEAVHTFAETVREIADEYTEASTDDAGNVFNTEAEERGQALEGWADELESWEVGEDEPDESTVLDNSSEEIAGHDDEIAAELEELMADYLANARENAESAVNEMPL